MNNLEESVAQNESFFLFVITDIINGIFCLCSPLGSTDVCRADTERHSAIGERRQFTLRRRKPR